MEISEILKRINLDSNKTYEANLENLKLLKLHFLLNIPYENLNFTYKLGFSVNILKIYEKVVEQKRGGICYETNTLFAYLLKALGYEVEMILANVDDITYIGYNFPHLALLVKLKKKYYLVDVGNGQNIKEPMPIDNQDYVSLAEEKEYKILKDGSKYTLCVNYKNKNWLPRYNFTKTFVKVADFENVFEQSDYSVEDAPLLVTQALENGRVTLMDEVMFYTNGGDKRVWGVTKENRAEVLRDYFNIELDFSNKR